MPETLSNPRRVAGANARTISRTVVNFWVDVLLLLVFLALAFSSVVLRFVFPAATSAAGWTLWRLGYDDWAVMQFGIFCAFALTVLLHVMLHWSWVCGVVAKWRSARRAANSRLDDGTQTLYGVGLLIVIVNVAGLAIAAAALCIRAPA
jgi:hypothetical protein